MKGKRAFGRPDDPFTYKIRLERAPWLPTKLQLELLDGCDSGDWVPKATQVVPVGQREVAWEKILMEEWADAGLGYKGKACKFRIRDLRNGRIFGPWEGPKVFDPVAWREWYQEQWKNGRVSDQTFEAHNLVAQRGAYTITYIEDYDRDINLLLAGFRYLDREYVQRLEDFVASIDRSPEIDIDPEVETRLAQFRAIFQTLDPAALKRWLEALGQALEQGYFDEEYNRLLTEGLDALQEAILVLLDSQNPDDAKEIIRQLTQEWNQTSSSLPEGAEGSSSLELIWHQLLALREEVEQRLKLALLQYELEKEVWEEFLTKITAGLWGLLVGYLETFLDIEVIKRPYAGIERFMNEWGEAMLALSMAGYSPDDILEFAQNVRDIVCTFTPNEMVWSDEALREIYAHVLELLGLSHWMIEKEEMSPLFPIEWRLDQGWGTIHIAANSIRQGWEYKGLMHSSYVYYEGEIIQLEEEWWAAILYLPVDFSPNGRDILAVARGDNCQECSEPAKVEEIIGWIDEAISLISSGAVYEYAKTTAGLTVITLAFTRQGADVEGLLAALEAMFGSSSIPIIVSWVDDNGQIWWTCIGATCGQVDDSEAEAIACAQQGESGLCGAKRWGENSDSNSDSNDPNPNSEEPIGIGSPLPCIGEICALTIHGR